MNSLPSDMNHILMIITPYSTWDNQYLRGDCEPQFIPDTIAMKHEAHANWSSSEEIALSTERRLLQISSFAWLSWVGKHARSGEFHLLTRWQPWFHLGTLPSKEYEDYVQSYLQPKTENRAVDQLIWSAVSNSNTYSSEAYLGHFRVLPHSQMMLGESMWWHNLTISFVPK